MKVEVRDEGVGGGGWDQKARGAGEMESPEVGDAGMIEDPQGGL